MDNEEITQMVKRAADLAADAPPELREATFRAILDHFLRGGVERTTPVGAAPPPTSGHRALGINELLAKVGPSTHVERVTAIAYHAYLAQGAGVSAKEIAEAYGKARTKKPQNIPEVIGMCIKRGYLIDADKKSGLKAWQITPTGERYVEGLMKKAESAPE